MSSVSYFNTSQLQRRFFTYFALLVLLVVSGASTAIFFFQKDMLLKQARDKAFRVTSSLAYVSLNAFLTDDYLLLQSLIDSMIDDDDILSIAILDSNGKIIAADQPQRRGSILEDPVTIKALHSETFYLEKIVTDSSADLWDTAVPIYNLDRRIGIARIKYSVEDTFAGLLSTILIIGGVVLLVGLVISFPIATAISRPIDAAISLARAYGQGNFDAQIPEPAQGEIGVLIAALNKLSSELKKLLEERIAQEGLVIIGEFAAYIIHDLKNPLNGIHLLADGLNRRLADKPGLKKYTEEILLASQRVEDFIRKSLDISKTTQLNLQKINLNTLIKDTLNEIQTLTSDVTIQLDQKMPDILADPDLLNMAFKNLLINASEATAERGNIEVSTIWDKNNRAIVRISDTGIGIPQERLNTIFRPFFSMKTYGHGLGLAMVKRAVDLHRGQIEVSSQLGKGSIFSISLPVNMRVT